MDAKVAGSELGRRRARFKAESVAAVALLRSLDTNSCAHGCGGRTAGSEQRSACSGVTNSC